MPDRFVADTHALVWFLAKDRRLSPKARQVLRDAEVGRVAVLVSTVVLAETLYLAEKKRVSVDFASLLQALRNSAGFTIVDFDLTVLEAMQRLPANLELHDRVLAATALVYGAKLISKDRELRALKAPTTIW